MRNIDLIVQDLRDLLKTRFRSVRLSSLQTSEQFLQELEAIHPDDLPGVIVVFDALNFISESVTSEISLTLVLVDRFSADSDDRALSVFRSFAELLDLFPADGINLNGVYVHPVDCIASSPDAQYAALALGIKCKQGF